MHRYLGLNAKTVAPFMTNNTPLSNVRFAPYRKKSSNSWENIQGGPIVLHEVTAHWMDSLVPSPNKKDVVYVHINGPGLHVYASSGCGGKKYICTPEAQCKSPTLSKGHNNSAV